jgi:DnaJ-class molecular chaperone
MGELVDLGADAHVRVTCPRCLGFGVFGFESATCASCRGWGGVSLARHDAIRAELVREDDEALAKFEAEWGIEGEKE